MRWRLVLIVVLFAAAALALCARMVQLSIIERPFLLKEANARIRREIKIPASRGMVVDRRQKVLAVSLPVSTFWFNPKLFHPTSTQIKKLAGFLKCSNQKIKRKIKQAKKRYFFYLKRRVSETVSKKIEGLKIKGLFSMEEYKRYYPQKNVFSHVLGFTNIDDKGQEGMELAYDQWLSGVPGQKAVIRDRLGRVVETLRVDKKPKPGKALVLSLDARIQYAAHRALKQAIKQHEAESGSIVVLDVRSGEVLAMVNAPTFNPAHRTGIPLSHYRNRAATDLFEPGSTIKPFTVALALLSKKYDEHTLIDTERGRIKVGGFVISDDLNFGKVNLRQLIQKSSNIAAAKILLSLDPRQYWSLLQDFGFGARTQSGFPGESAGLLVQRDRWQASEVATLAYGYGISVTTLQLAHAYSVFAAHGISHPVSLLKLNGAPRETRVLPATVANQVLSMMESAVKKGTGRRAAIKGYRVAGKTGTAYIAKNGGYNKKDYVSSFVGIAPVSDPRLVVAVVISRPRHKHFGARVAAPAFRQVVAQSLRLLNVPADRF